VCHYSACGERKLASVSLQDTSGVLMKFSWRIIMKTSDGILSFKRHHGEQPQAPGLQQACRSRGAGPAASSPEPPAEWKGAVGGPHQPRLIRHQTRQEVLVQLATLPRQWGDAIPLCLIAWNVWLIRTRTLKAASPEQFTASPRWLPQYESVCLSHQRRPTRQEETCQSHPQIPRTMTRSSWSSC
jgi:hypothetical protein